MILSTRWSGEPRSFSFLNNSVHSGNAHYFFTQEFNRPLRLGALACVAIAQLCGIGSVHANAEPLQPDVRQFRQPVLPVEVVTLRRDVKYPGSGINFSMFFYGRQQTADCTISEIKPFYDRRNSPEKWNYPAIGGTNGVYCNLRTRYDFQPGDFGTKLINGKWRLPIVANAYTVLRTNGFTRFKYDRVDEMKTPSLDMTHGIFAQFSPSYEQNFQFSSGCESYVPRSREENNRQKTRQYWFDQWVDVAIVGTAKVREPSGTQTRFVSVGKRNITDVDYGESTSGRFKVPKNRNRDIVRCGRKDRIVVDARRPSLY